MSQHGSCWSKCPEPKEPGCSILWKAQNWYLLAHNAENRSWNYHIRTSNQEIVRTFSRNLCNLDLKSDLIIFTPGHNSTSEPQTDITHYRWRTVWMITVMDGTCCAGEHLALRWALWDDGGGGSGSGVSRCSAVKGQGAGGGELSWRRHCDCWWKTDVSAMFGKSDTIRNFQWLFRSYSEDQQLLDRQYVHQYFINLNNSLLNLIHRCFTGWCE